MRVSFGQKESFPDEIVLSLQFLFSKQLQISNIYKTLNSLKMC